MIAPTDLLVAGAALVGAFASGLSGFAFGLIVLGVWLHVLPPVVTGPLVLICGGFTTAMSLAAVWPTVRVSRVLPMIFGGLVGIPVGIWLLTQLDPVVLRRSIGVFMTGYALFMLATPRLALRRAGPAADAAIGFVGGAMSGSVGLSGAVPTAWSMLRGWRPDEARAVYQPFNLPILLASLAGHFAAGVLDFRHLYYAAICLPMLPLGVWLGLRVYRRINAATFRRIVLLLLLASGLALVF
jgi:hypothetical protein